MAKVDWGVNDAVTQDADWGQDDRPAAKRDLPTGVKPSEAGAGRGSVNPPTAGERTRTARIAEMDEATDPANPNYSPLTSNAQGAIRLDAVGGMDVKRTRSPGRVLDADIPPITHGSAARDVAAGALQIGPTAVKGVGDVLRLATGDTVGKGVSEFAERGNRAIQEVVGSERSGLQRRRFEQDMADPALNAADVIVGNPGALADQVLPTVGSMALPVGAAKTAEAVATGSRAAQLARAIDPATVAARAAKASDAAVTGTIVAQNAGDTYSSVRDAGGDQGQAYLAAAITAPATYVASRLTGGGAEGQVARNLTGRMAQGGARGIPKAMLREGGQETGEQIGQSVGETVGTGAEFDPNRIGKELAVAGTLGAVVGGAVDLPSALTSRAKVLRDAGEEEAAALLERRAARASADGEIKAMGEAAAHPRFQETYRMLRDGGTKPAEAAARAGMLTGFAEIGEQAGLTPKAVAAASERASKLPLEQVPSFMERFVGALTRRGAATELPAGTVEQALGALRDDAMGAAVDGIYGEKQQAVSRIAELVGAAEGDPAADTLQEQNDVAPEAAPEVTPEAIAPAAVPAAVGPAEPADAGASRTGGQAGVPVERNGALNEGAQDAAGRPGTAEGAPALGDLRATGEPGVAGAAPAEHGAGRPAAADGATGAADASTDAATPEVERTDRDAASGYTFKLNGSGTLTIRGDTDALIKLLADGGVTRVMRAKTGVLVGVTEAAKAQKLLEKQRKPAKAAPKPQEAKPLSVGMTPSSAEPVTVKNGVVYVGKNEALDFDSGEPITVAEGATDAQIKQALIDGGAISKRQHFYGGEGAKSGTEKAAPLYASRKVLNGADIVAWAKKQGFKSTLAPEDMHVTIAYSSAPVDAAAVGKQSPGYMAGKATADGLHQFDGGAVVLKLSAPTLQTRWQQFRKAGASWDFPEYQPHITITYDKGDVDLAKVKPYAGPIELGPETVEPLDVNAGDDAPEVLTSPTKEDILAQQERKEQAEKEEARQRAEGEKKAKADAERGEFTLTGSDRAADVAAAAGQTDIFAKPEPSASPAKKGGETATGIARAIGKAEPEADVSTLREKARKAITDKLGRKALDAMGQGSMMTSDELTQALHDGQYEAVREFAAAMPTPVNESDIPMRTAVNAYAGTSHSPERRGQSAQRDYVRTMAAAWKQAQRAAGDDPAAVARITEQLAELVPGYRSRVLAALGAHGRVMSSMIAGPANFPVRSNQKRSDTADKRSQEASEFLKKGVTRMLKAAKAPVDNTPEGELERVRANLAEREKRQADMKAANAALRKGDDEALKALGFTEAQITKLKTPDFAGRAGFADYQLANNNAEIRRLRERLASAEARVSEAEEGPKETERDGVRIEENARDDRLRLFFDGKPADAVRDDLKANGFHWSPKAGAWQRQLTDNARQAARRVLDKHYPAEAPSLDRSPSLRRSGSMTSWKLSVELSEALDSLTIPYRLHDTVEDAARSANLDLPPDVKGMYWRGTLHLIGENLQDGRDAELTMWHEANHAGLDVLYGDGSQKMEKALRIVQAQNANVRERAKKWMVDFGEDWHDNLIKAGMKPERAMVRTKIQAVNEALSQLAGENAKINGLARFVATLQEILRSLGLKRLANWLEGQSNAEALSLILKAREAVTTPPRKEPVGALQPAFGREKDAASLARGQNGAMNNAKASQAFKRMVAQAEDDLVGVLFNWNDSRLSEDKTGIDSYPGRDSEYSRGKDGGRVSVSKREFMEWLFSDAPFDAKVYDAESLARGSEWRGQIERLRGIANEAPAQTEAARPDAAMSAANAFKRQMREKYGDRWMDKATAEELAENRRLAMAAFPSTAPAPKGESVEDALQERGETIVSRIDAERRWTDGDAIYAMHENADEPHLVRSLEELRAYAPDQLMALPQAADGAPSFSRAGTAASTAQPTAPNLSPWRDATGRLQFAPGAWLWGAMGKYASPMLAKVGMKPMSPELARQVRQMKLAVAKAQETAAEVAGEAMKLSQAERNMVSDLIEQELSAGTIPPEHAVRLAAVINGSMGRQTDELVRLGMLSPESAEMWRGKYLPRYYQPKLAAKAIDAWADAVRGLTRRPKAMPGIRGKHLKGRGMYETIPAAELAQWEALGWQVRDPDYNPSLPGMDQTVLVWRDFTQAERERMGEIRDAGFRFVLGYMQTQRDVALGQMFEGLAANPELSSRTQTEQFSVRVPDGTVEGTGAKRYGRLGGRWVSQETMSHLSQFEELQSDVFRMYRRAMAWWKQGKTSMNPVAHFNNTVSNVTMAHFAGVGYQRIDKYLSAARDFTTGKGRIQEARDAGLFLGTISDAELMNTLPAELRALVQKQDATWHKIGRSAFDVMTFFLRKPMSALYQGEDLFFRYLIYKDARDRGMEPQDAVEWAQEFIFAYDDLPATARKVRDFGIPFFAYTFKAIPAMAETALKHPVRFITPAAVLMAANAVSYAFAVAGDDDDWLETILRMVTDADFRAKALEKEEEERKLLPTWMRGTTALMTPRAIRLGVDRVTELPLFLDVSRMIPGGDMFDVAPNAGGVPWLQPFTPSHPIFTTAVAMFANRDMYFGKDIVDSNDTSAEASRKRLGWLWRQLAPAVSYGNYHFERAMNAVAQITGKEVQWLPEAVNPDAIATGIGRDGNPTQPKLAAMQTFGVKVRPIDLDTAESMERYDRDRMLRDIDAEMRKLARLTSKGAISERAYERAWDTAQEKKQRLTSGLTSGLTVDGDEKK